MKKIYNLSNTKFELNNYEVSTNLEDIDNEDFNVLVIEDNDENKKVINKYNDTFKCIVLVNYTGVISNVLFTPVISVGDFETVHYFKVNSLEETKDLIEDIVNNQSLIPFMKRISSEEISCKMVDLTSKKKSNDSNKLKILIG